MLACIDPDLMKTRGPHSALTWDFVRRLRDVVRGRLLLKGIETREDPGLAVENGVDGIIVSNHGGRAADSGRGTIEVLPEVMEAVDNRIPVLIDGGFRRGTDIFKALALGARAICIGRPYIWGLSAFGQPGVERVLEILKAEFELVMRQSGATSTANLARTSVTAGGVDADAEGGRESDGPRRHIARAGQIRDDASGPLALALPGRLVRHWLDCSRSGPPPPLHEALFRKPS